MRVPRTLGFFGVGWPTNPRTTRSQLKGGMACGLDIALTERSVLDGRFVHFVNAGLAECHLPVNADVRGIEIVVFGEEDGAISPLGGNGLGEVGIVGAAAAIANAVNKPAHQEHAPPLAGDGGRPLRALR